MIKFSKILLIAFVAIGLCACKKTKTPEEILTSKTWRFASQDEDKNPSTNPSPNPLLYPYYFVSDCHKDDRFQFKSNGKLQMFYGEENCIYWLEKELMDYEYKEESQYLKSPHLIIDGNAYPVLEISEQQIKFLVLLPFGSSFYNFIVLLQ